jgi:preprotein translocase subunit SecF
MCDSVTRDRMSDERRQKLQERITWLAASKDGLERNFRRSPRFVVLLLLVAPAWYFGGGLAAFYIAFMTGVFVGVWVYVAWSHLHENEGELKSVRAELRRLDAAASKQPDG